MKDCKDIKDQTYDDKDYLHGFSELTGGDCFPYTDSYEKAVSRKQGRVMGKEGSVLDLGKARARIQQCLERIRGIGCNGDNIGLVSQAREPKAGTDSAGLDKVDSAKLNAVSQKLKTLNSNCQTDEKFQFYGKKFKFELNRTDRVVNVFQDGKLFYTSQKMRRGFNVNSFLEKLNNNLREKLNAVKERIDGDGKEKHTLPETGQEKPEESVNSAETPVQKLKPLNRDQNFVAQNSAQTQQDSVNANGVPVPDSSGVNQKETPGSSKQAQENDQDKNKQGSVLNLITNLNVHSGSPDTKVTSVQHEVG